MPIEILAYEETPLGLLCLRRRELASKPGVFVTEVTLNHQFLMSSYLTESERELAMQGLRRVHHKHANNQNDILTGLKNVLVGGLGLGYTAAQALNSTTDARVQVIEYLPQVINWLQNGIVPLAEELKSNPRLTVTQGDVYQYLSSKPKTNFDLIVIDVDHSPEDVLGDQSFGFYTCQGLTRAREHLLPGGVLGVWSYAEDSRLLTNMKGVFSNVEVEKVTVWNDLIDVEQTDWLFFGRRED